ncbi:outer membrane receptor protein involved in Fe transport [Mariniflexile fucanivorans]|uniref:Outer membrane receptor protein involved in Fe transport n=1 Tax=Mariniflexile fucanivorans TaxID=264023 RepID=A0A4R1RG85_9FLAO|nr:outer membrane beta-barrel family protein [Mariniflexile fucanivorans]TCL64995.1 outer membrane receptor protein involved in Fe transport [Mariniflexile fucanivorans]
MLKRLIICCIYAFSLLSFSQNFILTGSVLDESHAPIAFSNVVLYSTTDFTFIGGCTTNEEGVFEFKNLKPLDYTIIISYLGFEDSKIAIKLDKTMSVGVITLKEKIENLNDVTVIAKRPTVKRLVDRLVFNVENSTLSNNNALDVLKHTPGVLVHDGTITVKNGEPTVYINDRKVHLSSTEVQQLLEGTTASNIKSIEVITNPPAKYEAEGGSVLNIVTSKNIIAGYNGSVYGNYKQGSEYPKYSFGTSHFFKSEKLNAYLNYNVSPRKDYRHNNEFINFIENDLTVSSWETDYKRTSESFNHNLNANIDYELNDKNSLGFSASILAAPRERTKTSTNSLTEVYSSSHVLDSMFQTTNKSVYETLNMAFTLDYVHKFNKEGEQLLVSAHHTNYDASNFQDVKTGYFFPNNIAFRNNNFQTYSSQIIQLYTGQLDYELPINETSQFEAGAKVSVINSKSLLTQYIFEEDEKVIDSQNSDTFLYDETNYAAYASYSKDWEHWSLKTGVRAEFTDIKGNSLSTNTINSKEYIKLFPSLYILNKPNENNEFYFNYNRRIDRPRYSELNPFKFYLNDNAYIAGDPNLKPQIDDNFTLGYTFNKDYTFEIYYRNENNPTLQITFQDNEENILKLINTNIDKSISYGLDFTTYTKLANRWNLYFISSLFYYENQFYALESNNELTENNKWSVYGNIINYFSFLKDESLTLDVSYLYISPIVDGPTTASTRHGLDLNLRKSLWKDKASISMGVTDVFNNQNFNLTTKYLNQDVFFKSRMENRMFTFGFNYKFGNSNLKNNQKEINLEERDRLISKNLLD